LVPCTLRISLDGWYRVDDVLITLDPELAVPLYRQLYDGIREAILVGRLRPSTKLPSSRTLAGRLGVARNTVLEAYGQLTHEGYLETATGVGTLVTRHIPEDLMQADNRVAAGVRETSLDPDELSAFSRRIGSLPPTPSTAWRMSRPFYPGTPGYDLFPAGTWRRLHAEVWREVPDPGLLDYGGPAGYAPLRAAIADYLRVSRGLSCQADQVIVTNGSQQALSLIRLVLLEEGEAVWLEDPGYRGARSELAAAGLRVVGVPVDDEGIIVSEGRRRAPKARLAYVTPSHQYPLGATMSLTRRFELLEHAASASMWVFEDDYDSEFRYYGRPLPALQGLDSSGRVIYAGTFSKVLFPSLRIGYLVVPRPLVAPVLEARTALDRQSPTPEQAVLAAFLRGGQFDRHLRRTRVAYRRRQQILLDRLQTLSGDLIEVQADPAGMHLVAWLPPGVDDVRVSDACADAGISAAPLSYFSIEPPKRGALILGYTGFREATIRYRAKVLAEVLEATCHPRAQATSSAETT
jgi:GntR family transcriptional regulator / MocR family aminotransferase